MKFRISNKDEFLAKLREVEELMKCLRFFLAHLPEEFELETAEEPAVKL